MRQFYSSNPPFRHCQQNNTFIITQPPPLLLSTGNFLIRPLCNWNEPNSSLNTSPPVSSSRPSSAYSEICMKNPESSVNEHEIIRAPAFICGIRWCGVACTSDSTAGKTGVIFLREIWGRRDCEPMIPLVDKTTKPYRWHCDLHCSLIIWQLLSWY